MSAREKIKISAGSLDIWLYFWFYKSSAIVCCMVSIALRSWHIKNHFGGFGQIFITQILSTCHGLNFMIKRWLLDLNESLMPKVCLRIEKSQKN